MSIANRLNLYETAQETIGLMLAMLTEEIQNEERKDAPDPAKLERLNADFDRLDGELYSLRITDAAAIQRVLNEYGPILKADFERHRQSVEQSPPAH
jgi:hypothetical protein